MKYLMIGAGGVGGCLAGLLMNEGHKDVAILARGAHRDAILKDGLRVSSGIKGDIVAQPRVYAEADTPEIYDVIFVTVKGYNLDEVVPFIDKASDAHTAIIPLLNVMSAGETLRAALPGKFVVEGVIYIAAEKDGPGRVSHRGGVFTSYIGVPKGVEGDVGLLEQTAADLRACGATCAVSKDIMKDKILKFSMISPMATTQIYYDTDTTEIQKNTPQRVMFAELAREVQAMARARGIVFEEDLAELNLKKIMNFDPTTTATTYRDHKAGGPTEIDSIIFDVVRAGRTFGFETPAYEMTAAKLGFAE